MNTRYPTKMKIMSLARLLLCIALVNATAGRVAQSAYRQTLQGGVRGGNPFREASLKHRRLPHHMHHGHGGTSYLGCLNYTNYELQYEWKFSGNAPSCTYISYGGYDDDSGGGGGGDDDDGGGGGDDDGDDDVNKNGNGGDNDKDGGDNDQNDDVAADQGGDYYADDDDDQYAGNDGTNGNYYDGRNGYDGNNGDRYEYDEDGYVVSNEDIADGNNDGNENPMLSFNITECNTYDNLWVWDLSFSCESDVSLANCECTFAEQLMEQEMLSCNDIESCPKDCPVCETCLQLVGCIPVPDVFVEHGTSAATIFAIFAAMGLFLFGIGYYYCRTRKNGDASSLEDHLIEKDLQAPVQKIPPPEQEQGGYDPETMLGPYPDVPDFKSDLSSLDSHALESGHSPPPASDAGNGVPDQISLSQPQPAGGASLSAEAGEQGKPVVTILLDSAAPETPSEATPSVSTEGQKVEQGGGKGITLVESIYPVESTFTKSFLGTYQPPNQPSWSSEPRQHTSSSLPPSSKASSVVIISSAAPAGVVSARKKYGKRRAGDGDSLVTSAAGSTLGTSTDSNKDTDCNDSILERSASGERQRQDTPIGTADQPRDADKDGASRKSSVRLSNTKPSDASDASPSEESLTPWIGDIDLSYTEPSFDDAMSVEVSESAETPSGRQKASNDVQATPTPVWLAPLADLEETYVQDETKPNMSEADIAAAETEPSVVWLAPSCSEAELAPDTNEDDSSTDSSWSPDDAGPWLAPI